MHYLFMPLDQHFDKGFGAVADSFKEAADSLTQSTAEAPFLNAHLPVSFLYRHAIELYLKSAILIFHRKLKIPYGTTPWDGEPHVLGDAKWKPMYNEHRIQTLYSYVRELFSQQSEYLEEKTRTDWSFPVELDDWIKKIETTDSSSTFFRYPVTKDKIKDKEKSAIREDDFENMLAKAKSGSKPLKAFLVLDSDDQVTQAFSHDDSQSQETMAILKEVSHVLYGCHAALVGELTGGR
ncbi:hypothetical protein [Rhodocyclus tenuis]|uniref:HEPN domain-containing protein n=1 Tax=Rhodocyclus tenuis TaxID=1066 RepID=A0A840G8Q5_RHOTE|nr:hypothetical protein [Rhodocyclus tenuis]MBB4248255.1 hypothetical protein [Rhodocyclus tenuis]